MPLFAHVQELPVFTDTPSPYCVGCGRTKYAKGFLRLYCDVTVKSGQGQVLDMTEGYMCVPCVRKMAEALPGTSIDTKERDSSRARALTLEAEADALREQAAGLKRAYAFVQGLSAPSS